MHAKLPDELTVSEESVPDGTVIWRYLKFEWFLDILKTRCLWFSRPFKFGDDWEGLPPPSFSRRSRQFVRAGGISRDEFDRDTHDRRLRHRYAHFVSCWHLSEHESVAMWNLYALANSGIAIQSTVGDVREYLQPHNHGRVIYYGPSDDVSSASIFGPHDILFKRNSFSFEQEYRFWFDDNDLLEKIDAGEQFQEAELSSGRHFAIGDMGRVVRRIVVAPRASEEVIENLRTACAEHHMSWLWKLIERSSCDQSWDSFQL